MNIFVDIDNTICKTIGNNYEKAVPIHENIDKINKLYNEGHQIIYWTARGGTSGKDWWEITLVQLLSWDCKFHDLRTDKPSFDVIIDDKAKRIEEI